MIAAAASLAVAAMVAVPFFALRLGVADAGTDPAGGILIDAVIIRTAIVLSLMIMLGRANWWLPRQLGRFLPRLHVQVTPGAPAAGTPDRGQHAHDAPKRWT